MGYLPSTVYPQLQTQTRSESITDKLAFICFAGFILTQAYAIPPFALPVNWVLWPSLSDILGIGMLFILLLSSRQRKISRFDYIVMKRLGMFLLYSVSLFVITFNLMPPEDIKRNIISITLWFKYLLIFWGAAHIPLDNKRILVLHITALIAFLWLTISSLASFFGILDLRLFVSHLPSEVAINRIWSGTKNLSSTAGVTPGLSSIVVLILAGLILNTCEYRKKFLLTVIVIALGAIMIFFSGSRQGVVRFATFVLVLLARGARRQVIGLIGFLLAGLFLFEVWGGFTLPETQQLQWSLSRQRYLIQETFTDEGMAGRPTIQRENIELLNRNPLSYILGYRLASYITGAREGSLPPGPHNMILELLRYGGIIALLIYVLCYGAIFISLWRIRNQAWPMVAVTAGMLTSTLTSGIWMTTTTTGWYLGLYFVCLHIAANLPNPSNRK